MLADTACDDCGIPFRTPAGGHPDRHRIPTQPRPVEPEEAVEGVVTVLQVAEKRIVVCSTCNERRWLERARAKGLT
jgi:hypothetical protein